jgi:hypothetical protein
VPFINGDPEGAHTPRHRSFTALLHYAGANQAQRGKAGTSQRSFVK